MFAKVWELVQGGRKAQILTMGGLIGFLAKLGQFLAFFLHWSPEKLQAWVALTDSIAQVAVQGAALWASLIAVEDSARKFGLPPPGVETQPQVQVTQVNEAQPAIPAQPPSPPTLEVPR